MSRDTTALQRCQSFINSNFVDSPLEETDRKPLALTLSRQAYSGSHAIAEELIRLLNKDNHLGSRKWALFDRDLVHKVLEDHNLPKAIARYMPEDRDHDVTGLINEILGLHPSLWELFHHTCDTIHKLANIGNVILIGRGAHIITRHLEHVCHARIVAPIEERVVRAARIHNMSAQAATRHVRQDDAARKSFVQSHFNESLEDCLGYDLMLNTSGKSAQACAKVLLCALQNH